jgi:hypothetical protein
MMERFESGEYRILSHAAVSRTSLISEQEPQKTGNILQVALPALTFADGFESGNLLALTALSVVSPQPPTLSP